MRMSKVGAGELEGVGLQSGVGWRGPTMRLLRRCLWAEAACSAQASAPIVACCAAPFPSVVSTHSATAVLPPLVVLPLRTAHRGKGMPISKAPGTYGNLLIKFNITFPRTISEDKKAQLRQLLS